jgi:hypothetical protein
MAVRKRGGIWYYDFMIRHVRYREAIPEARTKAQAEQVETKVRLSIFEGKYCKLHLKKVVSNLSQTRKGGLDENR